MVRAKVAGYRIASRNSRAGQTSSRRTRSSSSSKWLCLLDGSRVLQRRHHASIASPPLARTQIPEDSVLERRHVLASAPTCCAGTSTEFTLERHNDEAKDGPLHATDEALACREKVDAVWDQITNDSNQLIWFSFNAHAQPLRTRLVQPGRDAISDTDYDPSASGGSVESRVDDLA